MGVPSAQQLLVCAQRAACCVVSLQPDGEPAGQQSVRDTQVAQAIAGWTMPRRLATTTNEAISRRIINTTFRPAPPGGPWGLSSAIRDRQSTVPCAVVHRLTSFQPRRAGGKPLW
jgi:hypothetical protein